MSSQHELEESDLQYGMESIQARERDYDSTKPRGRHVLRCEHERLQSLLRQRKTS